MSVSRGAFLKALGKSLPGMVLGGGVAATAQALLTKMAAASGNPIAPATSLIKPLAREAAERPVEFIHSGPPEGNQIALTFDDGPTPGVTDRILDELKQRGLHVTFFMIGERVLAHPKLARRVVAEGHEIGHHTFTHAKLTRVSDPQFHQELEKTFDAFSEVLGVEAAWFRPPYGALRQDQARVVERRGMRVAFWSVDANDWSTPEEGKIEETILRETKAGAILLCHDLHEPTARCMGRVLDALFARDFRFVTVSGLFRRAGETPRVK